MSETQTWPQHPQHGGQQPGKKKSHVLGIIALVTAILGFIFACVPGALIIGWILLPIAFILSLVALFMPGKKWPAVTGLILAIVGTIVGVVVFAVVVVDAADEAFNEGDKDYAVSIDGSHIDEDYEGKRVLVVDYTFTNNSDDPQSFGIATDAQAFQEGVELEDAFMNGETKASKAWMKEIKPGKSIEVQEAYVLDGKAAVKVEVTATFDFDETKIAQKKIAVD